jgi:DNA-binding MarR family transcriptional regulator
MDSAVKPQGCTNFKLRQLMRRVGRHYDAELGKSGLKTTQYSLLSHAILLGPVRPVDLATAMKLDASTLTRNLRPLVDAGWLELGPGPDGRSRLVSVTQAGREKRHEAQRRWRVAQEGINQALGARRIVQLHCLIDECLASLSPLGEGESDE